MIMGSFIQKTIWSRHNDQRIPSRYHLLYRLILPLQYFMIALYGELSIGAEIRSIDTVFGTIYGDAWSFCLMVGGLGALVGISFYKRLIWLEAASVVVVATLMVLYIGAILFAAILHVEPFRYLSLLLVLVFLPMPCWRILDITRELRPPRNVS